MRLHANLGAQLILAVLCIASTMALPVATERNLTAQAATEHALLYAYPLLAFKKEYNSLAPRIGINEFGHARQLATSQARTTVKPNADTIYSAALYDISRDNLYLDVPELPSDQYALLSFHDLYGNNFALLGQEELTDTRSFYLTHEAASTTATEQQRSRISSPTTFGILMIRWLFKGDNLNTIHSLQNATTLKPVPRQLQAQSEDTCESPSLDSVDWSSGSHSLADDALRLLCRVGAVNKPGRLAGATVQDVVNASGFCADSSTVPGVDLDVAERNVLAELRSAGQASLEAHSNGWSVIRRDLAGRFSEDYGLRAQIALTGYLMLQAPAALYPSWSNDSTGPPLQGDILQLGPGESYIYTFSGRPPLGKLGFWSLTVYHADGYLIENPRNVSSLGDRSNITYPSGGEVYGPTSRADHGESFQLLVQPADVTPPAEWTNNWLPGPSGGGRITALLRFYNADEELLNGRYQLPIISRQHCITGNNTRAERSFN